MWLVADPCGRQYVLITEVLLALANVSFSGGFAISCFSSTWAWIWTLWIQVVWCLCSAAHLTCVFTDPGVVPLESLEEGLRGATSEKNHWPPLLPPEIVGDAADNEASPVVAAADAPARFCKVCQLTKAFRVHHCSTCERCIYKMDHHCMFINNCVGARNQKMYIQFLVFVLTFAGSIFLGLVFWLTMLGLGLGSGKNSQTCSEPWQKVLGVVLVLEAFLAARFVRGLLEEQHLALTESRTLVERMQSAPVVEKSLRDGLFEVMGGPPSWRWLSLRPLKSVKSCS
mmetsp:Transcript_6087/g.8687  ORF Transcript_6087/g.8687 Transcript_6087/m.8687 type:complete len:285 (+) Transcript_6087:79-933(+)